MNQHPVPQNIASYQFRLIGDMTLKQFLELAGGLGAAWIIFSLNLTPVIKLPLAFFAGLMGAALAFLPLEERPLDRWIVNFFRSIYSPTQYIWQKQAVIPAILTTSIKKGPSLLLQPLVVKDSSQLKQYLQTFAPASPETPWEKQQANHLQQIADLLQNNLSLPKTIPLKIDTKLTPEIPTKAPPEVGGVGLPLVRPARPLTPPILVESTLNQRLDPAVAAQFSTTLPIPGIPEVPNLIVGMVLNDLNKIIPNALIEIIDSYGETARALKTNKLGQFFCASPLPNGLYELKIDHPDYNFAIIKFKTEGKIIPPIKIIAKKGLND